MDPADCVLMNVIINLAMSALVLIKISPCHVRGLLDILLLIIDLLFSPSVQIIL